MDSQSQYKINSEGKEYAILSTGKQAVKDNMFIRKGQHMEIEGREDFDESNKQVLSEKSKIMLCKGAENIYGRNQ